MKNPSIVFRLLTTTAILSALPLAACKKTPEETPAPAASMPGANTAPTAMDRTRDAAGNAAAAIKEGTASAWADLKDATYDERLAFSDGVNRLATNVDGRLAALKERSGNLSENGMERLREARATLQEKLDDLGDSTAANWNQAKAAVADAWERVEQSYRNLEQEMRS